MKIPFLPHSIGTNCPLDQEILGVTIQLLPSKINLFFTSQNGISILSKISSIKIPEWNSVRIDTHDSFRQHWLE